MVNAVSQAVWSNLFYLYMAIAVVVGTIVTAWTLYTIWRYRERPNQPRPADAPRAGWITRERGHVLGAYVMAGGIAAIMFGLAFSTLDAVNFIEVPPADEPAVHFDVVGFQFGWQFRYYGEYMNTTTGQMTPFNFTKVNDMRVPVNTVVTADVTSRDVQHVFGIPEFRVQIYATSASVLPIWFKATETGEVPIRCLRNCGTGHDDMIKAAKLTVLTAEEYQAFIAENAPRQQEAAPAAAAQVQALGLLVEDGQLVVDEPQVQAGQPVALTVMNREAVPVTVDAGPADAPWATLTVPAGGEAVLRFDAPTTGEARIRVAPEGAAAPALTTLLEVIPQ